MLHLRLPEIYICRYVMLHLRLPEIYIDMCGYTWDCQKLSTMGNIMKMASLAVPAKKAATQTAKYVLPCLAACTSIQ